MGVGLRIYGFFVVWEKCRGGVGLIYGFQMGKGGVCLG